jgi:hypothetical protein
MKENVERDKLQRQQLKIMVQLTCIIMYLYFDIVKNNTIRVCLTYNYQVGENSFECIDDNEH